MTLPVVLSTQLLANIERRHSQSCEIPLPICSQSLIEKTIRDIFEERQLKKMDYGQEDAFFVCDLGVVHRQFRLWRALLPNVTPHYAVKCNNDKDVVELLGRLGSHFDCASIAEIEQVISLGFDAGRILYANTVKHPSHLSKAAKLGVQMLTFDNSDELFKIKEHHPRAKLLLRIITNDSGSTCPLSCKFGADLKAVPALLALASEMGLKVVGVAFHIGSGGNSVSAYRDALSDSRKVFDMAHHAGHELSVLDIGGGFESSTFEAAAACIRDSLAELMFAPNVQILAEPGRFMVADAFTLVVGVIGRRWLNEHANEAMLYVTDGCYGNLNCIIYDHQEPVPELVDQPDIDSENPMVASVWGPTCDGLDKISSRVVFPRTVNIGDWLCFRNVGAYTLAASTTFNGFNQNTKVTHIFSTE